MEYSLRLKVFRCIDKMDRVGPGGLYDLLTTGRKDESGAFIEGAGLDAGLARLIVAFNEFVAGAAGNARAIERIKLFFWVMQASDDELTAVEKTLQVD